MHWFEIPILIAAAGFIWFLWKYGDTIFGYAPSWDWNSEILVINRNAVVNGETYEVICEIMLPKDIRPRTGPAEMYIKKAIERARDHVSMNYEDCEIIHSVVRRYAETDKMATEYITDGIIDMHGGSKTKVNSNHYVFKKVLK